jgi:exopolyphosphatase / guanosine-5'-triphosphate,3'-diphosphate pyrophosphatase
MYAAMPKAVLDVGSNTIRLLVGSVQDGIVESILDRSEFVRLGAGVDTSGELRADRQEAAIAAIRELVKLASSCGADRIAAIATSAVRDAHNGADFARRVRDETGVDLEIISGDREAELTFRGATMGLTIEDGVIVCDLGGGSAELIYASAEGVQWAVSEPLGSGRLTERFISHDPPEDQELALLRKYVESTLRDLPAAQPEPLIFTGGTATHVGFLAGTSGPIQKLDMAALDRVLEVAITRPAAKLVETYGIRQERAEVLAAGVTAIETIARFYGAREVIITQAGIREGTLLEEGA